MNRDRVYELLDDVYVAGGEIRISDDGKLFFVSVPEEVKTELRNDWRPELVEIFRTLVTPDRIALMVRAMKLGWPRAPSVYGAGFFGIPGDEPSWFRFARVCTPWERREASRALDKIEGARR